MIITVVCEKLKLRYFDYDTTHWRTSNGARIGLQPRDYTCVIQLQYPQMGLRHTDGPICNPL